MHFAGIDIGSTMTKVIIIDENENIKSYVIGATGPEHRRLANKTFLDALKQAGLKNEEISYAVATGYGRINVPFADRQLTELTCHSKGVLSLFPNAKTVIDIGGQDSKAMKIKDGKLVNYVMNDKCAAGTGRFLEVLSESLDLNVKDLGSLSLNSKNKIKISNMCVIFAKDEIINHISKGALIEDIVAGLNHAIVNRVVNMARRIKIEPDVVLTGGVAMNEGIRNAMEETINYPVFVPSNPLCTGALGAALLGKEIFHQAMEKGEKIDNKKRIVKEVTFFETK
jgi:predicted CoA-substrate-specific enzyme activase